MPETLRGGSWNNDSTNARASNRNRNEPDNRNNNIGVRCVGEAGMPLKGIVPEPAGRQTVRECQVRIRALVLASGLLGAPNINLRPGLW
jgi:Sulfatase-modifying factor enzyme 1